MERIYCSDANSRVCESTSSVYNIDFSNSTTFKNIEYMGCSHIIDPVNEAEIKQIMESFNRERLHDTVSICLQIPSNSSGTVRLFGNISCNDDPDLTDEGQISSFPVNRIRFCARGMPSSLESSCFALSFTQYSNVIPLIRPSKNSLNSADRSNEHDTSATHQCHVFRCTSPDVAGCVLRYFAQAFKNSDLQNVKQCKSISSISVSNDLPNLEEYEFETFLEIKESEGSNKGYAVCPFERNCFKLRRDREKMVVVVLRQTRGERHLKIKKCFGLLLAAGRNLRDEDMHLLDVISAFEAGNHCHKFNQNNFPAYTVEARWNPSAQNFEVLNTETPKETRVFMTIAIDVILGSIDEPVRFIIECKARIFQQFEMFWQVPRKAVNEKYFLIIKKVDKKMIHSGDSINGEATISEGQKNFFKVAYFKSLTEREKYGLNGLNSPTKLPTQLVHPVDDDESDSDEPLLSGSGDVNRECSDDILLEWNIIIEKWKAEPEKRPIELNHVIKDGIPDILRGEVWQLLSKAQLDTDLHQTYRMLLDKECPSEQVILRDIHRTFPAHDFFKDTNGIGQEALFKISKAYSLYDEEVSYCQGLSFLAASLLLHMKEEHAFCVLIKIMFDYGLRDLFKLGFDALHFRFYQLQRLIQDYEHELFTHFQNTSVETHMYASQWFLTLFTAKFPLQMVYFIIDLFLTQGMNTIFHISLALLQDSKKELLQLDFEGILKYFRVTLPRKYRTESGAKELIRNAVMLKISHKRLSRYEKDYRQMKEAEMESTDPLEREQRDNAKLRVTILRLERENDDLAHELVTSKIELRNKLDVTEDQLEYSLNKTQRKTRECENLLEMTRNLRAEADLAKDACRQEILRLNDELCRLQSIVEEYKRICAHLSASFDSDRQTFHQLIKKGTENCGQCSKKINELFSQSIGNNEINALRGHSNGTERAQYGLSTCKPDADALSYSSTMSSAVEYINELMERLKQREAHVRQVELELAQTKLALVESQCKNQDLAHQMSSNFNTLSYSEIDNKSTWIQKTISSIRDVGTSLKQQHTANDGGVVKNSHNNNVCAIHGNRNQISEQHVTSTSLSTNHTIDDCQ